jgi:CheY-like chemotaxis protein
MMKPVKELKYDVRRGADTYRLIYHSRLKSWILRGMIKKDEALVWRSGLSGWRKPEELEELKSYFEEREKERQKRKRTEKPPPLFYKKKIRNILIIDDEEDLCWLLSNTLKEKGYDVGTANSIEAGIRSLNKKPDLIFLDLKLPDGDGMDILPAIKAKSSGTFVVIISAYGSEDRMVEAKEKGVHSFIDKPFTEEKIVQTLSQFQGGNTQRHE